jgi:hypothetical protein
VATTGIGTGTVSGPNNSHFDVDLEQKSCSCGLFVEKQFPCKHALKLIELQELNILDYVHPCYLSEKLKLAYSRIVPPVQLKQVGEGESAVACLPPEIRKAKGRPKAKRSSSGTSRQMKRTRHQNEI